MIVAITTSWAATETPGNSGTADTQLTGTSYSIGGDYIAGAGSTKIGDMATKGVKIRTNKNSSTLVISVNAGYRIDGLTIYGVSNDNSKTVEVSGVSIDGEAQTFTAVTFPNKKSTTSATIALTDIAATDNITLSFGTGAGTQLNLDFHFTYTQTEVVTQEITAATLYGSAISATDLETLKTTKALTVDGSSYNGVGVLGVTLSSGAVTPTVAISGNNAVYSFTINSTETYTVTVTDVVKSYTAQGTVVSYAEGYLSNSNKTLTVDGIAFNYASKTFGYANNTAGVTMGGTTYKPIKLSTGEAVTVTFPDGKKATKIIVYGWSNGGNGKLVNFGDGGSNTIDTSDDIFFGEDLAANVYPSVYEYEVDNWEAFTFQGNGGQPYVVFDFVFVETPTFSLTSSTIASDETSQIQVGSKGNLDGVTLTDLVYDDTKISIDENGVITPLAIGGPYEITFNSSAVDGKYFASTGNALSITVTSQTYSVTYDLNGGSGDAPTQEATAEGGKFNLAAAPSKDFTNFAGWLCDADNQVYEAGAEYTMTAADTKFTAQWSGTTYSSTLDFAAVTLAGTTASTDIADFFTSGNFIASDYSGSSWESSTAKSGFWGYKLKKSGATVKFMAQEGKRVTITLGSNDGAVTLIKNGTEETIASHKGDDYRTVVAFDATEDVLVEIVTTGKNTVTLNKIAIEDALDPVNVTVGTTGFATIGMPFATTLPTGVKAYAVSTVSGTSVTVSDPIAAGTTVPAGKGFIIVANPNTYAFSEFVGTWQGDAANNKLEAVGATAKAATTDAPIYVFAKLSDTKVGFKKATSGSLGAYKAYLPGNISTQNTLSLSIEDEATAINGVAEEASDAAPVKVLTAKGVQIGKFNVVGQQVK